MAFRGSSVTGVIRDGWVEIRSHLKAGDAIVSRGHADLIDGSVVVARNPDGTLAVSSGPRAEAPVDSDEEVGAP